MSDLFNDKHLLWWIIKALEVQEYYLLLEMQRERIWKDLGAPDWVHPAIREKIAIFERENNG